MLNFMMGRQGGAPRMSPQEAVEKAKNGEITVVDVRDPNELMMSGKAAGAINIPLSVIRMQADPRSPDFHPELDVNKPVAVYCASGARSSMAAQVFQQAGFTEVHNIGGLGHWQMAGGEIVRA
ncbi:MAG: rhodanese-like domain-containing protein [Maritimibacter sp.]|jgi:rhodanese-related sulfurtransferase